jgi:hypothetical protein
MERLKRATASKERQWEEELSEKTATINRLTKLIKEAQNQCAEMVIESHPQRQRDDEEVLRAHVIETDMKRLQSRNRELRLELESTRRELQSKSHLPEASFRSLLRKEAWEEEKHALESQCEVLKRDLASQRASSRREMAKLASSHKNQLATVKRKVQLFQTRVERLARAHAMSSRIIRELKHLLANVKSEEDFEKRLNDHVAAVEEEFRQEWERSVKIRDAKWKENLHKVVEELKQHHHAQVTTDYRTTDANVCQKRLQLGQVNLLDG